MEQRLIPRMMVSTCVYIACESLLMSDDCGLLYYCLNSKSRFGSMTLLITIRKVTPVADLLCILYINHTPMRTTCTGGLIPLHNACSFGHADVVSLLLKNGADPNSRDNWNFTPLHEAAIKGKVDVCISKSRKYE